MTQDSLLKITLATIENYRHAAHDAMHAYQVGSLRFIDGLNKGIDEQVYSRTSKVAPQLTQALSKVRGRVTQIVVKGIDQVASRTESAVGLGYDGAAKQVVRAADFAAGIDNAQVSNGLQAAARWALPTARVALAASSKVSEGAKALSGAAAGQGLQAAAQKARRAQRKTAAVSGRVAKAVRQSAAASRKTVRKAAGRAQRKTA